MYTTLRYLGIMSTKVPITVATVVSYVLPPVFFYPLVAVLAIKPRTHTIRVAIWPLVTLLALRAVVFVDISLEKSKLGVFYAVLMLLMFFIVTRTFEWTLAKDPLVRRLRPANSPPSTIMDALDLICNFRGHGWNWSRGLYIPHDSRPTHRTAFVAHTSFSAISHALLCGILHRAILSLCSVRDIATIPGGSILFDPTLAWPTRYLRSSILTVCTGFTGYAMLQTAYDACAVLAIVFLGQDPAQWPPAFDAPWRATSLSAFWGRRWHQWARRFFLVWGGYPLGAVAGRPGMVVGAFLASAIYHHIVILCFDSRIEAWWMLFGFGMMAPGVLAESLFWKMTGRRVGGVVGWVWTMTWLVLWGNLITEGFGRIGAFSHGSLIDWAWPVRALVERLVVEFDGWLRAVHRKG